mmetsp:Transcript_17889/g.45785  ORF Transcript_17889/g.45785 Transcript_17889/m.45785 type:complete len:226 (+) Transcript_17889:1399-2076(+)
MEARDGLRELGDADARRDGEADCAADADEGGELLDARDGGAVCELRAERGAEAKEDAGHAECVAEACGGLLAQPADGRDAGDARREGDDGVRVHAARALRPGETADEHGGGEGVHAVVLLRVGLPLEEAEHLLGHKEATSNIDGRGDERSSAEHLRRARELERLGGEEQHGADGREAGDGVGDGHEGGVEGGGDAEDSLISGEAGESERAEEYGQFGGGGPAEAS